MKQRTLGQGKLKVSALGLGTMGMSEFYGVTDKAESRATLERALELGVTLIDTADMYGVGRNEELVGEALRGKRERVVLATKFGFVRAPDGRRLGISGRPEYVRAACDASLKRLKIDTIDIYYQHRVDPDVPLEETVGAMRELVLEGKVRFLGLSEVTPDQLRRAHRVHSIAAVQSEYSLWSRDVEDVIPTCRELNVGFVAYSPLGRGFLTGQIKSPEDFAADDIRRGNPRFQGENFQKNLKLLRRVEAIAADKGVTAGQIALAWLLSRGQDIVPIPGTKRVKYLEENVAAADVALSGADLERLGEAIPRDAAAGDRYPDMKAMSGTRT